MNNKNRKFTLPFGNLKEAIGSLQRLVEIGALKEASPPVKLSFASSEVKTKAQCVILNARSKLGIKLSTRSIKDDTKAFYISVPSSTAATAAVSISPALQELKRLNRS